MIIRIGKRGFGGKLENQYIAGEDIIEFDHILSKSQIENLKYYGKTTLSAQCYQALPESVIITEIERLINNRFKVKLVVEYEDDNKLKPRIRVERTEERHYVTRGIRDEE